MDLYIQMGHGMQAMCEDLAEDWGEATIILSPINIKPDRMSTFSKRIQRFNGQVLFDPQMYFPRKYHKNLEVYSYWPTENYTDVELGKNDIVIKELASINEELETTTFILPSQLVSGIGDVWNKSQKAVLSLARKLSKERELYSTISLAENVLQDDSQIARIVQYTETWDVDGFYITCEHPQKYYLVDNPLWLANLMSLVAGLKRTKKKVIVGYASHQMLCLALAKCDAIASGNYLNVRWFQPERFETADNDGVSRRAKWYYCPQALSEFKITFLDIAKRPGIDVLDNLKPSVEFKNKYSDVLFAGALPSSTNYTETMSHCHYLYCLKRQCQQAGRIAYAETYDAQMIVLKTAERLLTGLRAKGIRGQDRDFGEIIDVNMAAIVAHDATYRFALSREWDVL